jgi:hypothetical protein
MLLPRDMDEVKIKEQNSRYPSIDGIIWLDIGVIEHAVDILGIDFHGE